jgi:hypothetical protein
MKTTVRFVGSWIVLALCSLVLTGFAWHVIQPQTTLKVNPQMLRVRAGQTAQVSLTIEQVTNLYGVELHLAFDPEILQVLDANPAQDGIQVEPGTLPSPDFVVLNNVDNQRGTIDYAATQLQPREPGEGEGVVARITFRAKQVADSEIQFEQLLLADTNGKNIDATTQPGQVQVQNNIPWILFAAAGLAVLLITASIGFAYMKRKRE